MFIENITSTNSVCIKPSKATKHAQCQDANNNRNFVILFEISMK